MATRRLDEGDAAASQRMGGTPPALTSSWLIGSQYTASHMTNLLRQKKPQSARIVSSAHESTFSGTGTASSRKGKGQGSDYNTSAMSTTRTADRGDAGLTMSDYGNTDALSTMPSRSGRHGSASEQVFVHPLLVAARDAVASLAKGELPPADTADHSPLHGPILPPVFGTGLMPIASENHSLTAPPDAHRRMPSAAASLRSTRGKSKKRKLSGQRHQKQHPSPAPSLLPEMEIYGHSYDASRSLPATATAQFNQTAPARIASLQTEKKPPKKTTARSAHTVGTQLPIMRAEEREHVAAIEEPHPSDAAVSFVEPQGASDTIRSAASVSIQAMEANIAAWDAEMQQLHEECHARRAERREDVYKFRSTYSSPLQSRNVTADSVIHAYESEMRRAQYRETRRQHEAATNVESETGTTGTTRSQSPKQKKAGKKKKQRLNEEMPDVDAISREQQQQFFRDYYNFARTMPKAIFPAFAPPLKRRVFLVEPYSGKNSQVKLYHAMLADQPTAHNHPQQPL